jgi:hypothetical protein
LLRPVDVVIRFEYKLQRAVVVEALQVENMGWIYGAATNWSRFCDVQRRHSSWHQVLIQSVYTLQVEFTYPTVEKYLPKLFVGQLGAIRYTSQQMRPSQRSRNPYVRLLRVESLYPEYVAVPDGLSDARIDSSREENSP